jgi:glucose-1-phosphate cytidylyltransferase
MKTVILAGGQGTRLSEYTRIIPKPMVKIFNKPILFHISDHYKKFGFKDFIIATGYKGEYIKKYFKQSKNFTQIYSQFLKKKELLFKEKKTEATFLLVNTGRKTMTGGRIKRLSHHLKNDNFMLTYGDGICDINIKKIFNFHKKNKKIVTITAVSPPSRFGALQFQKKKNIVVKFEEKKFFFNSWINGGYFVMKPEFLKYLKSDSTYLEREPLQTMAKKKQLIAFKHKGFWQCMDTIRDKKKLELYFRNKKKYAR